MNDVLKKLIPHRKHMALIDEIVSFDEENFTSIVKVTTNSLLYTDLGVPSYTGFEYMAQTVAAYNTYTCTDENLSKIGFIIAIRNYKSTVSYFKNMDELIVSIKPILKLTNSGSFECSISLKDEVICTGKITAYVPTHKELEEFKKESEYE